MQPDDLDLPGRTVVLGVGSVLRGDDGFGPVLATRIGDGEVLIGIDAGTTPENQGAAVRRVSPSTLLLADAADLKLAPGEWRLLETDEVSGVGFSTHNLPLNLCMEALADETGARVLLLAVQPARLSFGEPLSPEVADAVERIAAWLHGVVARSGGGGA